MSLTIQPRPNPLLPHRNEVPRFNEGASSTAKKITSVVLSLLTALVSFLLLPAPVALLVSLGFAALNTLCCCVDDNPRRRPNAGPGPIQVPIVARPNLRWYQRIFRSHHPAPLVDPRPREVVGDGHINVGMPRYIAPGPRYLASGAAPLLNRGPVALVHPPAAPPQLRRVVDINQAPARAIAPPQNPRDHEPVGGDRMNAALRARMREVAPGRVPAPRALPRLDDAVVARANNRRFVMNAFADMQGHRNNNLPDRQEREPVGQPRQRRDNVPPRN
ncbi:MAG: hypothetical protein V4487_00760 [Chlamydiota bacterium]